MHPSLQSNVKVYRHLRLNEMSLCLEEVTRYPVFRCDFSVLLE